MIDTIKLKGAGEGSRHGQAKTLSEVNIVFKSIPVAGVEMRSVGSDREPAHV